MEKIIILILLFFGTLQAQHKTLTLNESLLAVDTLNKDLHQFDIKLYQAVKNQNKHQEKKVIASFLRTTQQYKADLYKQALNRAIEKNDTKTTQVLTQKWEYAKQSFVEHNPGIVPFGFSLLALVLAFFGERDTRKQERKRQAERKRHLPVGTHGNGLQTEEIEKLIRHNKAKFPRGEK